MDLRVAHSHVDKIVIANGRTIDVIEVVKIALSTTNNGLIKSFVKKLQCRTSDPT